jgi:hypothetical protein
VWREECSKLRPAPPAGLGKDLDTVSVRQEMTFQKLRWPPSAREMILESQLPGSQDEVEWTGCGVEEADGRMGEPSVQSEAVLEELVDSSNYPGDEGRRSRINPAVGRGRAHLVESAKR